MASGESQLEPPPPKMCTIFCLLEGENDPFPVEISDTQSVGSLKEEIKKKKSVALVAVDANRLKLYHVNLEYDVSDEQEHVTRANEILQGLTNHKPLSNPLLKLSTIEENFTDGLIHILVQLPPSESIHSRACGAVAETVLISYHSDSCQPGL